LSTRTEIFRPDKRRAFFTVGIALLLAGGAVTLVGRAADFDEILDALRQADKLWFPVCLVGLFCAYAGYILGYREVARMHGGPSLPLWTVARIVGIGFGANVLGSAAGGLAVDFWALHRAGAGIHDAARRVLGFNTLEWALLGTGASVAAVAVLAGAGSGAPLAMTLSWIIVVPVCMVAAVWISSPRRRHRFATPGAPDPGALGRSPKRRLARVWAQARKGLADAIGGVLVVRHLVTHPRRHRAGILGFAVYWFGHLFTLYAALRAFGVEEVDLAPLVLAFATGYVATALPLPGGGSGGIEAALAFSLHAVGVPLAPALLGALVYRFFTFWLPILPALALFPAIGRLDAELDHLGKHAAAAGGSPS
jgi:uncharacterized membrane protein YbhN (UPF0104 family)